MMKLAVLFLIAIVYVSSAYGGANKKCVNHHSACNKWAKAGYCRYTHYKNKCPRACGRCNHNNRRVCYLPKKPGRCYAYIPRWYYNKKTGCCTKFIYGGCGANGNNFSTKAQCQKRCVRRKPNKKCVNHHSACHSWAKAGYCRYAHYQKKCPKSCGRC